MYVRNGVHKKKCSLGKARRSNLKKVLAILGLLLRLGQYCVVVNFWDTFVLTSYKNHPGGNLDINIKLWNLTWRENHPLQSICKSAEQAKSSGKIAWSQITAHIFWGFPSGRARTIWFSNRNFWFSQVPGEFPAKPRNSRKRSDSVLKAVSLYNSPVSN